MNTTQEMRVKCTNKTNDQFSLSAVKYIKYMRWQEATDLIAWTTTTLNSSGISDMNDVICFIRRSTLLSLPVYITTTQWQQRPIHNVSQSMLQLSTSLHYHLTKSSRRPTYRPSGLWEAHDCPDYVNWSNISLHANLENTNKKLQKLIKERNIICIVNIWKWKLLKDDAIHSHSTMLSSSQSIPGQIYDRLINWVRLNVPPNTL